MGASSPTVAVVAGNPKPGSRTLDAGVRLAEALTGAAPDHVVDVVDLGAGLLGWGDPGVAAAVSTVASSSLVVVASPTYKATYTGLLKVFLDQFETGEGLRDVVCVPLMLGAGPAHAMAPEAALRPLLAELGGTCPAPGLYLRDKAYADDGVLEAYVERWGPALLRSVGAPVAV